MRASPRRLCQSASNLDPGPACKKHPREHPFVRLSGVILPLSNRDGKRKHKLACRAPLSCPQPISLVRPRRRLSLAPTVGCRRRRAQVVSRLAALRGHRRLGLDTAEHDGRLVGSGTDGCSFCHVSRRSFDSAGYTVLFAVEPSSPHHGLRGIRRRNVPNALTIEVTREESRGRRDPSRQGRRFAARAAKGLKRRRLARRRSRRNGPAERFARGPHAMQDDRKLAGDRHGRLLPADALGEGTAPRLQIARFG